ncbi:MAG TPA: tetratricopeptide repeat protein [Polyangiaceae bacterium]|jgi:TolA-binding protein|nr:tetratricopeptide repeat protein [Polyangiaceae bacterium]
MDEFESELQEIKREIVESRSLTIKTNNLVNALAADVKSISKRFQGYERRLAWNSATAYAVFVALSLIAGKLLFDARVDSVRAQTKDTRDLADKLDKELKITETRDEARTRAERRAADYYSLIAQNKRREIIDQYDEVSHMELSRTERLVFDAALERAKNELSVVAYQTGLDYVRTARWHEAEQAFRDSLNYKSDAAHSSEARYQLSITLRALGRQREAIPMLIELSEASADKEVVDDATFLLAQCQVDIEAWNDAKTTLRTFIRRFPSSAHLNDARAKLADIQLYH